MSATAGVRSVILCNSMIYGHGLGLRRDSAQIPALVSQARKSGVARHVGQGLNIWSNVHIEDVVELYLLALKQGGAGTFYYVENGEASFSEIVKAISRRLGLGPAQPWAVEDAIKEWGLGTAVYSLGSNSRISSRRAREELGWAPKHADVLDWIRSAMQLT